MNLKGNNLSRNLNFELTDQFLAFLPGKMRSKLFGMILWHQGGYSCRDAAILQYYDSTFSSHFHSYYSFLSQVKEGE